MDPVERPRLYAAFECLSQAWARSVQRSAFSIQRSRGQALVEMALVFAVLLLLIFGGIDVLQNQMTQYTVSQAVRAAAHQAALIGGPDGRSGGWGGAAPPTGTVAETARLVLDSGMTARSRYAAIAVTCARTPCRRYDPITIRITYREPVWAPLPGLFSEVAADLSATRLAEKDAQ